MIGRKSRKSVVDVTNNVGPKGFDDFKLRLGDVMRGERATLGKSLLDVQRELRIKAAYVAAIENADPSAFETPGFIAGYVRSYARYLNLDPDEAFEQFCAESGFHTAHGMSSAASTMRKPSELIAEADDDDAMFTAPSTPFIPAGEALLSAIDFRALGSSMVLIGLIVGLGYGGWSVLNEVQRVQIAPVEQTPVVLSDLDPLAGAGIAPTTDTLTAGIAAPTADRFDRIYRPEALDVPVLTARDEPIASIDPTRSGIFTPDVPAGVVIASADPVEEPAAPTVLQEAAPEVVLMAVRPAWVRIRGANGNVLMEKILDAGEEYVLPASEEPPTLRAGMSGSLYFKVNGELYGPAGEGSNTVRDVALAVDALTDAYDVAVLDSDPELARVVAELAAQSVVISGN